MEIAITLCELLKVRNLIILESETDLCEYLKDEKRYNKFIEKVYSLLFFDRDFFYVKNYSSKIINIINTKRAAFSSRNICMENNIEFELNKMAKDDKKEEKELEYYFYQNTLRGNLFKTNNELLTSIAFDYDVVTELNESCQAFPMKYFVATTSFLLNVVPDYYINNQNSFYITKTIINKYEKSSDFKLNKMVKKTKKRLLELENN